LRAFAPLNEGKQFLKSEIEEIEGKEINEDCEHLKLPEKLSARRASELIHSIVEV
jgi:hypothetical protein